MEDYWRPHLPPPRVRLGVWKRAVDWIFDSCHAGYLLVALLYSHRCLDDLLIKYCSAALRIRIVAEMEFVLCQEGSSACQRLCPSIKLERKCVSRILLITPIVVLDRAHLSGTLCFSQTLKGILTYITSVCVSLDIKCSDTVCCVFDVCMACTHLLKQRPQRPTCQWNTHLACACTLARQLAHK